MYSNWNYDYNRFNELKAKCRLNDDSEERREINIDKNGNFSEPIVLIPGLSVITIDTQDKFGKDKEKKFQVVYNESAQSVAFNK